MSYLIQARNVNQMFPLVVAALQNSAHNRTDSRNGPVIKIPHPVILHYERPTERVLFNTARDANPFFHLYEAMWMLAGRNDLASVQHFVSNFGNYSDDGVSLNGAYGYRWRHACMSASNPGLPNSLGEGVDQLSILVEHLRSTPNSRRAVLQMWNVEDDLLKVNMSKDVCCNLSAVFSLVDTGICSRDHRGHQDVDLCATQGHETKQLDMTVFNRSNDAIWGALGANAVHFSFLQEYLAARLGVGVGSYYQISNDLHAYLNKWEPNEWLQHAGDPYSAGVRSVLRQPLVSNPETFDSEVRLLTDTVLTNPAYAAKNLTEPFLKETVVPAVLTYAAYKRNDFYRAGLHVHAIKAQDWRVACRDWIERRENRRRKTEAGL